MVQETFLAAVKSTSFAEQSSPRTWLTGILKYKIIDVMRKSIREFATSDLMTDEDANMDDFFMKQVTVQNNPWLVIFHMTRSNRSNF